MNEEEKKAIENLKEDIEYADLQDDVGYNCIICYLENVETILNLTEKQQKEIKTLTHTNKSYKGKLQEQGNDISRLKKEIFQLKIHKYSCPAMLTTGIKCDLKQDEKEYLEQIKEQITEIENLKQIEEEHRIENGKLREEIEELKAVELKAKGGHISVTLEGLLKLENEIKARDKEIEELKKQIKNKDLEAQKYFDICMDQTQKIEELKKYKESSDFNYEQYQDIGKMYFDLKEKLQELLDSNLEKENNEYIVDSNACQCLVRHLINLLKEE